MRSAVSPPPKRGSKRGGTRFRSVPLLLKAMRHQMRKIRPTRLMPIILLCGAILGLFFLVLQTPVAQLLTSSSASPNKVIGETSIGTPLLSLPEPYGFGAPVMAQILPYVREYLQGGAAMPAATYAASADSRHLHGKLIGHDAVTQHPLWTPTPFDFTKETKAMKRRHHAYTCFNRARSNSLPLDRPVPDVRPASCAAQWYNQPTPPPKSRLSSAFSMFSSKTADTTSPSVDMPGASILIMFYNEPLSPLLRTVHSVLDRTPPELLHEVVLIDDGSDEAAPWLLPGGTFERHLQTLPKVRMARLRGRNGLMRARNIGAALANGKVLVFLDSHIEVTENWIEPLTARVMTGIRDGIDRVVVPAIDNIEADTFKYMRGGIDVLGHTWGLGQTGVSNTSRALDATKEDEDNGIAPRRSPIMAGGLFALSREYFDRLGFYDPEMRVWGGEEMEISFRIWQCGGTLEWVPCSRVGHVFRSPKFWQGQVYKVPGEVVARNKWRASFWMDEFSQLAHLSMAPLKEDNAIGSMKFYEDIRKRLHCKPYRWFLKNVYPQMLESGEKLLGPTGDGARNVKHSFAASGYVRNPALKACLDHLHFKADGAPFGVYPCHYLHGSQSLLLTKSHLLVSGDRLLEGCLTREDDGRITQRRCSDSLKQSQEWKMEAMTNGTEVQLTGSGKCLTAVVAAEKEKKSPFSLRMKPCGGSETTYQAWNWEHSFTDENSPEDGADDKDDDSNDNSNDDSDDTHDHDSDERA